MINGAESTTQGGSACNTCAADQVRRALARLPGRSRHADADDGPRHRFGTDRQFYGKPCSPYTMRNGIFGYWCFDPADGRAAGGADRAVRRPLDARREPLQRVAVLHGAVQRDGAAGLGEAVGRARSRSPYRSSGSPGTAAGSTSGSTTFGSTRPKRSSDRRRRVSALAQVRAGRRRRPTRPGARAVRVGVHARDDADAGGRAQRAGARAGGTAGRRLLHGERRRGDAGRRNAARRAAAAQRGHPATSRPSFGCSG